MRPVDFTRPYDVQHAKDIAAKQTVKGMFINDYVRELKERGAPWPKSYTAFKDYPATEIVEIIERLAKVRAPTTPLRQAWHELATNQYPTMRDSMIGKVIYGVVGNSVPAMLKLAARGYAVALSGAGPVRVVTVDDRHVVAEITGQAMPVEGWHTGVWAGAIASQKRRVTHMAVDLKDEGNGLMELYWE